MIVKRLSIPEELIVQAETTDEHKNYGKECFIAHSPELETALEKEYAQRGLCLKVFKDGDIKEPERFRYGGARLPVCTTVQNFFASHGIAPRVYDVAVVNEKYLVQVVEYATGDGTPNMALAKNLVRKYKIGIKLHGLAVPDPHKGALKYVTIPYKWVGGLFVDFGRFVFLDPKHVKKYLRKRVQIRKGKKVAYQPIREMDIPGQRNHKHRLKHMRLDDVDFNGKTVLDLGCNNGTFCREAIRRGAARVVGVDFRRARVWQLVNDWLGYWNLNVLPLSLPDEKDAIKALTGIEKFDIVFALAIIQHMEGGYDTWIADLTKEVLFLEGNWNVEPEKYRPVLEKDFDRVELTGYVRDEDKRAMFRCWKVQKAEPKPLPRGRVARRKAAIERGRTIEGRVMIDEKTLGFLYDMAKIAPKGDACEVGVMCGSSLVTWAAARPGKKYAVDNVDRPDFRENLKYWGLRAEVLIGDSAEVAKKMGDLAFCFIDADHTEAGIPRDIVAYTPKIVPGGIVVFHDYDEDEGKKGKGYVVFETVNKWQKEAKWEKIGQVGITIAFRRPETISVGEMNDSQPSDRRGTSKASGGGEELPFSEEPRANEDIERAVRQTEPVPQGI